LNEEEAIDADDDILYVIIGAEVFLQPSHLLPVPWIAYSDDEAAREQDTHTANIMGPPTV
jgi:hypothetical protein